MRSVPRVGYVSLYSLLAFPLPFASLSSCHVLSCLLVASPSGGPFIPVFATVTFIRSPAWLDVSFRAKLSSLLPFFLVGLAFAFFVLRFFSLVRAFEMVLFSSSQCFPFRGLVFSRFAHLSSSLLFLVILWPGFFLFFPFRPSVILLGTSFSFFLLCFCVAFSIPFALGLPFWQWCL